VNNKFEAWGWLVIISGVVMTAVLFGLIGVAIFAIIEDRPVAYFSVIVITISLLALWAITWGALWLISGVRKASLALPGEPSVADRLAELLEENDRLRRQLAGIRQEKLKDTDSSQPPRA